MKILLNEPVKPCLTTLNNYLEQVNENGQYTNFGPLHKQLTEKLEEYLGVRNLLLVSNGTLALHVAYRALNVKRAICTPFSFTATASSLGWENIPYDFVDIDRNSLNLDAQLVNENLKKNPSVDTVVATHVYGNPCDVDFLEQLQKRSQLKLIYDGAHAFGVKYRDKSLLTYGDATTLSFHATKIFHTIEGGAIIFSKNDDFKNAKRIINFNIDQDGMPRTWGINAKFNEYQAAVGLTLLNVVSDVLDYRRELFALYYKHLNDFVKLPVWSQKSFSNGAYFPIILGNELEKTLVKTALENAEIPTREYFSPSLNTVFKPENSCPVSEAAASTVLCLPLHYYLTRESIMYIVKTIKKVIT